MWSVFAIALAVWLAGFVQGLSGFGSALIAVPLLSLFLDIKLVVPLVSLMGLAVGLVNLAGLRARAKAADVLPLLGGALFGIPLGVYFLRQADEAWVMLLLAALLIGYALSSARWTRCLRCGNTGWLFGLLSGCLSGAFSSGGPPAVIYTALQPWPAERKKATLVVYFIASGVIVVSSYTAGGLLTRQTLEYFAWLLPLMLASTVMGIRSYRRLSDYHYTRAINLLLLATGLLLAGKALRAWW